MNTETTQNPPILDPTTLMRDGERWINSKLSIKIDEILQELSTPLHFIGYSHYHRFEKLGMDLSNFPCDKRTAEDLTAAFNTIRKFVAIPKNFKLD